MRLVRRKIYRAFPELDGFDDRQCRQYIRRMQHDRGYLLVCIPSVLVVMGVLGGLGLRAVAIMEWRIGLMPMVPRPSVDLALFEAMFMLTMSLLPPLAALLVRDAILRAFLRRKIGRTKCLGCGYSLLGQRQVNQWIRCPECGRDTTLEELGLRRVEDLAPPGATRRADAA